MILPAAQLLAAPPLVPPHLAAQPAQLHLLAAESRMSGTTLAWYLVAAVILIAVNGLFVAYEFGILAAKRSTFESPRVAGRASSRAALASMSDLSMQLAGAQLGITMASLGLGYVGEPAFGSLVSSLAGHAVSENVAHGIGVGVALAIVVFLHLVLGEMVPKNVALADPDQITRWLVLPYRGYLRVVRPFVRLLNAMANGGCRLLGVEPRDELVAVHSASELAAIVSHSGEEGAIEAEDAQLLSGALEFALRPVGEIATPLGELPTLRLGATAAQAERVVASSGQQRIPVLGPDRQRPIGYVHARDLLGVASDRRTSPLPSDLVRNMAIVRSDRSLVEVLRTLRRVKRQMALVVADGETVGVVSVEDVIGALLSPPPAGDPVSDERGLNPTGDGRPEFAPDAA